MDDLIKYHDDLAIKISIIQNKELREKMVEVTQKYLNWEILSGDIKFELLNKPELLEKESQDLHHCVRGYNSYIAEGKSVIFKVFKNSNERATLEIRIIEDEKKRKNI